MLVAWQLHVQLPVASGYGLDNGNCVKRLVVLDHIALLQ